MDDLPSQDKNAQFYDTSQFIQVIPLHSYSTWVSMYLKHKHIDGFVQDCSISSALAMEILQSCTKPLICLPLAIPKLMIQLIEARWRIYASVD